jgi:carboxyl-terminal processing protease
MRKPVGAVLSLVALLSGCGGGGGGSGSVNTPTPTGSVGTTPAPSPTPTAVAGCSLRERQDWVAAQMREWYLFPETLPANLDPTPYTNVSDYLDALTATARSQRRDRYFTYLTSIKEEDAYYASGATAGFGVRLALDGSNRLFVTEAFEGAPAAGAGLQRGTEIQAIGTSEANLQTVQAILANGGGDGLTNALGPDTAGTSRTMRISDANGTRVVTVAKADYALPALSANSGTVIDNGGQPVGYINLRSFISTADPALRSAFARYKAAGVTNFVIDLRYNGGGLVNIAELMGDLLGGNRSRSDVFDYMTFRPEKASENSTHLFTPQPESVAPTRIAFIGSGGTASASELVINGMIPYLHGNVALVGSNTYGKPVGQIALDLAKCDDRLRVIAFALENSAHQGSYFDGLASKVEASCRAADDIGHPMGDPAESSTQAALAFLGGRSCTPITASAQTALALKTGSRELLTPARPSTVQREVPGAF